MATAKVQVNARLDPDVYRDLYEVARVRTVSVSSVIEEAIVQMLKRDNHRGEETK